jgi:uncharacterized membrane protein YhhN
MQNTKSKVVLVVLAVVASIELYCEYYHLKEVMFFTKPLILPLIAVYFSTSNYKPDNKVLKWMLGAFLFSWFGDISLMLTPEVPSDTELMGIPKSKYFFLAGLGSFLVAQLLFIFSYKKCVSSAASKTKPAWFAPFVIYWIIMMAIVLPPLSANTEKSAAIIPVIVYATILISMAAFALLRFGRANQQSFILTFIGACIFVVSDSLIAINFLALTTPMPQAGFLIMSTYIAAEFLIAQGILEHFRKTEF